MRKTVERYMRSCKTLSQWAVASKILERFILQNSETLTPQDKYELRNNNYPKEWEDAINSIEDLNFLSGTKTK